MGDPYAETNAIARRELIDRLYRELAAKNAEIERLRDALDQIAESLVTIQSARTVARSALATPYDAKEAM